MYKILLILFFLINDYKILLQSVSHNSIVEHRIRKKKNKNIYMNYMPCITVDPLGNSRFPDINISQRLSLRSRRFAFRTSAEQMFVF